MTAESQPAGDWLTKGLQRLIDKYGLPYVAYNQGAIVRLECSGVMLLDMRHPVQLRRESKARKQLMEHMGAAYAANGLMALAGSRMYTSMADAGAVIDDALARFEQVFPLVEGCDVVALTTRRCGRAIPASAP
jgi:hypothetical protein